MHPKLEKEYRQLETAREALFNELKKYPDDLLNKKPKPEAWSVAEVIGHLMTAEAMSLKYLQKKVQDTSREKPEGLKHKWRWLLVRAVFTFDIKFKAPEMVEPKTGYSTLGDLQQQWQQIRSETHALVNRLSAEEVNKQLWKHAVAGKMNLHHMYKFFGIHFRRHQQQIERTLRAIV